MKKNQGNIIRKLFRGSVVSIIAAAVAAMLGLLIDGVIISKFLGQECMAAYSLVTPVMNVTTAFSGILSTGAQVVCAQQLGAGRADRARRAFSMCMAVTAVISVVLVAAILIFRDPLCMLLGARGKAANLLPLASDYMLGMVFCLPSVLLLFEFNSLMRLDGDANRVVYAVAIMTVLDVVGDLLNALVLKGGMFGMGLATTISYTVALVIMLFHFRRKDIIFRFSLKGLAASDLRDILYSGAPSAVGSISAMGRSFLLNQIMLSVAASAAVAALGIITTVNTFLGGVMMGIGMTTTMLAGIVYGEQDATGAKELLKTMVLYVLVIGAVLTAALFLFAPLVAQLFIRAEDAAETLPLAVQGLRFYALAIIFYGLNNGFVNYTQGVKQLRLSNIVCFIQNFVFVVSLAFICSRFMGTNGVWIAFPLGEVCTLLVIVVYIAVKKHGFPGGLDAFTCLPENFGAAEGMLYEFTIRSGEQVIQASQEVMEFCKSRGGDRRVCMFLPLCVEELGNNIVKYGFTSAKDKQRSIDVRVICCEDGWMLRVRDNAKPFDPVEWLKLHDAGDDPTRNIGLRMVCGMAKDVQYLSVMDLNNLIVQI